jgi:hypothetical protein
MLVYSKNHVLFMHVRVLCVCVCVFWPREGAWKNVWASLCHVMSAREESRCGRGNRVCIRFIRMGSANTKPDCKGSSLNVSSIIMNIEKRWIMARRERTGSKSELSTPVPSTKCCFWRNWGRRHPNWTCFLESEGAHHDDLRKEEEHETGIRPHHNGGYNPILRLLTARPP